MKGTLAILLLCSFILPSQFLLGQLRAQDENFPSPEVPIEIRAVRSLSSMDPQNLKQYAYASQTTPYGNQRDFQNFNGNNFDTGWNTLWRVRTQRTDEGYYAEFAIPQSLTPYRMTYAAKLIGVEVPPPFTNLRFEPYALYQYDRTKEGQNESSTSDVKVTFLKQF